MSPDSWTKNPIEKPLRATEASLEHRLTGLQEVIGKLEDRVKELEKKFSVEALEALEDKTSRV